jgi:hypothetical protein
MRIAVACRLSDERIADAHSVAGEIRGCWIEVFEGQRVEAIASEMRVTFGQ